MSTRVGQKMSPFQGEIAAIAKGDMVCLKELISCV